MTKKSTTEATQVLTDLLGDKFSPDRLDQAHDLLKLLGIVLGQMALLEIVTDRGADEKARVSAARALMSVKEDPETIAERLRRSVFADLTTENLHEMFEKARKEENGLDKLLENLNANRRLPEKAQKEEGRP